ncbi:hypothetical protein JCM6882_009076 [Rhodosporidiobolus microsporus]
MKTAFSLTALATLAASAVAAPALQARADIIDPNSPALDDVSQTFEPADSWTHLSNQGDSFYLGTESYTHDPNGSYSITLPPSATVLSLYAAKKDDRGYFDVYFNNELVGVGNAYSPYTTEPEVVFELANFKQNTQATTVTVKNRASDYRLGDGVVPYLALDRYSV